MFEQTELHVCVDCNRLLCEGDGDNEVLHRENPFAAEINVDYTKVWLCGTCHYESLMDV